MKFRLQHIAMLLVVWLVAACNPLDDHSVIATRQGSALPSEAASPELAAIDSLMWQQPDSALTLLLPWFDTVRANGTFDNHYAHLLLSELLYKNDCAQANRVELQRAVTFFDSQLVDADTRGVSQQPDPRRDAPRASAQNTTNAFFDARAHYINGVGYYEHDSIVQACQEYLTALEIMENRFEEKELVGDKARFMALINTRLSDLFSDYYLHEQAICFARSALSFFQKQEIPSWFVARMLCEIGTHYDMMNQLDSAEYYYVMASYALSDTNMLMYRDISALLAYLSYKKDKEHFSIIQLERMLLRAENENEYFARCAVIGDIFYHEKQFDSAQLYLNKVFQNSSNEAMRRQSAKQLVEILTAKGRDSEILEYAEFLAPYATLYEDRSTVKSQLVEIFNRCKQQELEQQHKQKMKKLAKGSVVVIVVLFVIVSGVLVLYWKNKRKKQSLETQMKDERYAHEMKQKALSSRLKMSNEALRQTEQQLEEVIFSKNKVTDDKKPNSNMAAFKSSPICQYIIEIVEDRKFKPKVEYYIYKDYALDRSQLKALVEAADQHLDNFTLRIRKNHPSLTDDDMKYCCLYLLGLNEADISALMQRAYSTICDRNRKIKRIIGTEGELTVALMEWV